MFCREGMAVTDVVTARAAPCCPDDGVVVRHRCCLGSDCADDGRDECDSCESLVITDTGG